MLTTICLRKWSSYPCSFHLTLSLIFMKLNNLHQARVSLSLVPLAQCFTLNLVKRRTFCTMDLPQTLESKTEESTNKHETFEFPLDSCPNKDSPEFTSLRGTCSHQISNHLLNFPSKMYRRVVVDAFVYHKHSKFRGSTMALILQLKHNQRMVVKVGTASPLLAAGWKPMVELMTINKELPGGNPTIEKNPSLKKIIRACL